MVLLPERYKSNVSIEVLDIDDDWFVQEEAKSVLLIAASMLLLSNEIKLALTVELKTNAAAADNTEDIFFIKRSRCCALIK